MPRINKTAGVSITPEMKEAAIARAESLGMSFSNYVQTLVRNDLINRGALVVTVGPAEYPSKQAKKIKDQVSKAEAAKQKSKGGSKNAS